MFDIVIAGAGLIGSSIAYHLSERLGEQQTIVLVDLDLKGTYSSSELNAGGARVEWWHPVNIALSKATIEFMEKDPETFGFRQKGYLWLYNEKGWKAFQKHKALYKKEGLTIEELTPEEVHERVSCIDRLDGIVGATFNPKDGLFNPNLLKQYFRQKAKENGVVFMDGAFIRNIVKDKGQVEVHYSDITDGQHPPKQTDVFEVLRHTKKQLFSLNKKIRCAAFVNAMGAWATQIARMYGHKVICQPVRRQMSLFDCQGIDLSPYGMFVDTSGIYFHAEGEHILAGYANPYEMPGYNFQYDGDRFFENDIWPNLMARMSKAEALKHITGWAGLYSQTPDRSGIIGRVAADAEIYEAHSFTGRGAMQSVGVGRALSELMVDKKYTSIDCTQLHPDRFQLPPGKLLYEGFHI